MKPQPCPRLFEAEAMRDGRLAGGERASFERHLKVCSVCSQEVQALDLVARALRPGPVEQMDELRVRRERTRLLAAFDRELLAPRDAPASHGRLLWPVGVAALVTAVLVWRVHGRGEAPARAGASPAVVHADPATSWSERADGDREVVALEHGALSIRVDHSVSTRRLVVVLPDGELEDTGTTFTVSADNGRTTRVAVQEGSVVLRLRGQPAIAVGAGDVWTPVALPAPAPALVSASASAIPSSAPDSIATPQLAPAGSGTKPAPPSVRPAPGHDGSADFSGPMAALERGDNRTAADGFARFLRDHASDARAEDAAYLRVIALQRCGDRQGTWAAALEYLDRYPAGFRRAEVEALAHPAPAPAAPARPIE
jgi:hypothetical protein